MGPLRRATSVLIPRLLTAEVSTTPAVSMGGPETTKEGNGGGNKEVGRPRVGELKGGGKTGKDGPAIRYSTKKRVRGNLSPENM
ncbi:unnamed protein product [Heligmosomoides polygyrus]|uniref:Secreted protein n=1 Tax=Heligmosomoides polygyrus TaxID=6339 RepID=A0A183GHR7_HELPZ|nr:unnamed protein product [Heligmosomoides polygyrus]